MIFDTNIDELVTDPPSGSHICPKCEGFGKMVGFSYWATEAEDCSDCNCNGWVLVSKNIGDDGIFSLDKTSDIYKAIVLGIAGKWLSDAGIYIKLKQEAKLLGADEIYNELASSEQRAYFIGVKRGIIKE